MTALTDPDYWLLPIRWTSHKGRHIACHDCIQVIHDGAAVSVQPARHKRTSGAGVFKRELWLCSTHRQTWEGTQARSSHV